MGLAVTTADAQVPTRVRGTITAVEVWLRPPTITSNGQVIERPPSRSFVSIS